LQHPFKKLKPVKSRVSEDDFKKCGKQEKGKKKNEVLPVDSPGKDSTITSQ